MGTCNGQPGRELGLEGGAGCNLQNVAMCVQVGSTKPEAGLERLLQAFLDH